MHSPTQIKFQGQLYVLASGQHKKCPKGQHWNDQQHKCVALSATMRDHHMDARSITTMANEDSRNAHSAEGHARAARTHGDAREQNRGFSQKMKHLGFNRLAQKHARRAEMHRRKELQHKARSRVNEG